MSKTINKAEFEECISLIKAYYEWTHMDPLDSNAQGAFNRARGAVKKLAKDLLMEIKD